MVAERLIHADDAFVHGKRLTAAVEEAQAGDIIDRMVAIVDNLKIPEEKTY